MVLINRIFILCIIILVIGNFGVLAEGTTSTSNTSTSSSVTKTETSTTKTSTDTSKNTNTNDRKNNNNNFPPDMELDENGYPKPPLDENGRPMPPPMDENGRPIGPPRDENGRPLGPPLDKNGKPIPFDQYGRPIYPQDDSDKKIYTYLIILSVIIGAFALFLLMYIFAYKKKINNKIKRLEQVKDMQSLEASNTKPLTTISPSGYIEDKRDVYSSQSSSQKKTPLYTESVTLQSTTSDASIYDDSYNYLGETDYNNNTNGNNPNYVIPNHLVVNKNLANVKNKYNNKTSLEKVKAYEGPYHSTPSNFRFSAKDDLDGLYAKTLEPYSDTDDEIILPPVRPHSMIYDTGAGISPIPSAYSPIMYNNTNSIISVNVVPNPNHNQNSLSNSRIYNNSLPNLNKMNYDMDLTNTNPPLKPYISTIIPPGSSIVAPVSPVSPTTPNSQKSMNGYPQGRMEPSKSSRRRSRSIDITKSKRNSYIERDSIHRKSPGLHSPINNSPYIYHSKSSVMSDNRSAKSVLINQMVHAMDMEAESDDTLSYIPMPEKSESPVNSNTNKSKNIIRTSTPKSKIMNNSTMKEGSMKKSSTSSHHISKVTPVSSKSSLKRQNTDTSKSSLKRQNTDTSKSSLKRHNTDTSKSSLKRHNTNTSKTIAVPYDPESTKLKTSDGEHSTNQNNEKTITIETPYKKKVIKKEKPGLHELNRDFIPKPLALNILSQESDYCYESNNSYNQTIFDESNISYNQSAIEEVKVFEVEDEDDEDDLMIQLSQ